MGIEGDGMEVLIVGDMTGFIGATTRKIEVITLDCMNSREESESSQGCWGRGGPLHLFLSPYLPRHHLVLLLIGRAQSGY